MEGDAGTKESIHPVMAESMMGSLLSMEVQAVKKLVNF